MFQKILVPLDGSKIAECALPYAEELAKGYDTQEVILISVTEEVRGRIRAHETQERYHASNQLGLSGGDSEVELTFGRKERQAQRYLSKIAKRMAKELEVKGVNVRTEVLLGPPAQSIISYIEYSGTEIIVMSSHGRSGPSRWAYGSVADKVFRASCIPILMIRAPGCVPGI